MTTAVDIFNPTRLVAARHRRAMTRRALTISLGLTSVAALGRIETGRKKPELELVEKMSRVLGFPIGFFYADDLPEIPRGILW